MTALQAKEIAKLVNGTLEGNPDATIHGAAGLSDASPDHLSFFHNTKYIDSLALTKAQVLIVPEKLDGVTWPSGKTLIKVSNPQWAYGQILAYFSRALQRHPKGVHATAVIEDGAQVDPSASLGPHVVVQAGAVIGARTVIYPNTVIGARTQIGDDCILYANVTLREDTQLGHRVIIHSGTVLGSDGYGFATIEGKHHKIPQIGRVVLGDDVEIGANCAIDRATTGETRIGSGSKLDNLIHIAHNVHIGKNCLIVGQVGIAGSTKVGDNVIMGGQVGVAGHLNIGDGVQLAAQTGVMNDVEAGEVLFGSPARPIKLTLKLQALFNKLPEIYDAVKTLRKKGIL